MVGLSSFIATGVLGAALWAGGAAVSASGGQTRVGVSGAPAAVAAPEPPRGTKLAWRRGGPTRLLWTGFHARGGGARVILQTSADVALESRAGKDRALFVLKRCRVPRRTDRLPLETRYFNSAVTRVEVRPRGADIEVAVTLRRPLAAVSRREAGPDGSSFWILDFPDANAATDAATASVEGAR